MEWSNIPNTGPGLLQIWIPLECPDLLHECCEELATEPPYQEAEWNSNTQFRVVLSKSY